MRARPSATTAVLTLHPSLPQFGVHATVDGAYSGDMASVILSELQAVAKGSISAEELNRAKTATVSSVLMNLESRAVVAEDIGRQILTYGERKSVSSFVSDVGAITAADLAAVATKLMKTPLTFVRASPRALLASPVSFFAVLLLAHRRL